MDWLAIRNYKAVAAAERRKKRDPFALPDGVQHRHHVSRGGPVCPCTAPDLRRPPKKLTFSVLLARLKWTGEGMFVHGAGDVRDGSNPPPSWAEKGWLYFKDVDEWLKARREKLGLPNEGPVLVRVQEA